MESERSKPSSFYFDDTEMMFLSLTRRSTYEYEPPRTRLGGGSGTRTCTVHTEHIGITMCDLRRADARKNSVTGGP